MKESLQQRSLLLLLMLFLRNVAARHDERDAALFDRIRAQAMVEGRSIANEKSLLQSFHGGKHNSANNLHHERIARFLNTDYINACYNPELLYEETGDSASCICDEEFTSADRVLCIVEGIQCRDELCTEEMDIWIFNKETGLMESRSTCVVCADKSENCVDYEDTCFNAVFDEHEMMTECSIMLQDVKPLVSCTNCSPCIDEEELIWGMTFDCFDGRWKAEQCVTGSRVGHMPNFPELGDPEFINEAGPKKTGEAISTGSDGGKGGRGGDDQDGSSIFLSGLDPSMLLILLVGGSILVGLFIGIVAAICMNSKKTHLQLASANNDKAPASPEQSITHNRGQAPTPPKGRNDEKTSTRAAALTTVDV